MKKILPLIIIAIACQHAQAQQSASASQMITVELEPTIQITASGLSNVKLGFNNVTNYINGVESGNQEFVVHSNRDFVVNVRANSSVFSYNGSAFPEPEMEVNNTLFLSVNENNTGGNIAGAFRSYAPLSANPCDLLLNCKNGDNKTFSVSYRASHGVEFPPGDYTIGVIYTATQP